TRGNHGHYFELVVPDFDIDSPRLGLNKHAVDARTLRAERSAVLRNPCAFVAGVADLDHGADLKGFDQVLCRHLQISPVWTSPRSDSPDAKQLTMHDSVQRGCQSIAGYPPALHNGKRQNHWYSSSKRLRP